MKPVLEPQNRPQRRSPLAMKTTVNRFSLKPNLGTSVYVAVDLTPSAAVIAASPSVIEAVVYGVAVPGAEGKAGMAMVACEGAPDLADITRRLEALPAMNRITKACQSPIKSLMPAPATSVRRRRWCRPQPR